MPARKLPLLVLACSLVALGVSAMPPFVDIEQRLTPEQMHSTGLDTLSPAQLQRLNELLRDEGPRTTTVQGAPGDNELRHQSYIGLDAETIKSRLKGSISGWAPGSVFELENGQKWKVLKGSMKLRTPMQAPEVLVVPGFAGRWFLQVDEDLPKARVYRID